jgi:hypothetical protein
LASPSARVHVSRLWRVLTRLDRRKVALIVHASITAQRAHELRGGSELRPWVPLDETLRHQTKAVGDHQGDLLWCAAVGVDLQVGGGCAEAASSSMRSRRNLSTWLTL